MDNWRTSSDLRMYLSNTLTTACCSQEGNAKVYCEP